VGSHALLPVSLASAQAGQLSAPIAQPLTQGTVVGRALGAGERHSFSIDLAAGDFIHAVIDQLDADVTVSLFGPDSTQLIAADSPNGRRGPERIAWIAATAGNYRLDVANAAEAGAAKGGYRLTVMALRPGTAADAAHARAERLFAEAEPLRRANTAVSRAAARERYLEALDIFSDRGLSYEQGLCLFNVGVLHLRAGEAREAIPYLTRARPLFNATTDSMYASVTNALGGALDIIGDPESAMAQYRETLSSVIAAADRPLEAIVRNNIGKLYADMADWQRALGEYRQALMLFQQSGDRRREGLAFYNIGVSYATSGDLKRGVEYLQQSLTIRRVVGDKAGEADTLTQLGLAETVGGNPRGGLDYYARALPLLDIVGDRRAEGVTLTYVGRAHLAAGDAASALTSLRRAVELRAANGDKRGEASAVTTLAEAHALNGNQEQSLTQANQAAAIFQSVGYEDGLALALPVVARAQRALGRTDEALQSIKRAMTALEAVRGGVSSPEMRASYLGRHQDAYSFAIDLLMQMHNDRPGAGFDAQALQTSERARSRSLLDMLGESRAELRREVDPSLVSRERQLAVLLDAKADRLIALQGRATSREAEALSREARTLEAEYEEVRSAIRAASPQYGALTQPRLLEAETIQRELLDVDTALLEYSLGPDSSFVWVVDRDGLKSYRLAPRAAIEQATREAYTLVTARAVTPTAEPAQERARRIAAADAALPGALRRLTDLVLTPIGVLPKTPRLVVVADGALQYLPFEILPVPPTSGERERPMIVDFEIVTLPSASTLSVQRARTAGRQRPLLGVAVFADPVFDVSDPRVRGKRAASISDDAQARVLVHTTEPTAASSAPIARLPFTDEEAKAILATAAGEKNLSAIGFAATKASVVGSALSGYRYVHFATHGFLDAERPSLSAIALSLVDAAAARGKDFFARTSSITWISRPTWWS
jgi:tetratricopeptide (TPR) repeat protein